MDELKPCPFCGGEADSNDYTTNKHMAFGEGWIGCRKCRVFMTYVRGDYGKRIAIRAWNRRAKESG